MVMKYWIILGIALLFNVIANVLMKIGAMTEKHTLPDAALHTRVHHFMNAATIVSILLFAANVLFYRKALSGLPITVAYPIMVSIGLVMVVLIARFMPMLNERVSWLQIGGMILIIAGVWMVSQTK